MNWATNTLWTNARGAFAAKGVTGTRKPTAAGKERVSSRRRGTQSAPRTTIGHDGEDLYRTRNTESSAAPPQSPSLREMVTVEGCHCAEQPEQGKSAGGASDRQAGCRWTGCGPQLNFMILKASGGAWHHGPAGGAGRVSGPRQRPTGDA
jgi:hypothetical protein